MLLMSPCTCMKQMAFPLGSKKKKIIRLTFKYFGNVSTAAHPTEN